MLAASVGLIINVYHTVSGAIMHTFPGMPGNVSTALMCPCDVSPRFFRLTN